MARLIDGDEWLRQLCSESCGCTPDQCGFLIDDGKRCDLGERIVNAKPHLMTEAEIDAWAMVPDDLRDPVCVEFIAGYTEWVRYGTEALRAAVRMGDCRIWTAKPTDELRGETPW